jgi:integrase
LLPKLSRVHTIRHHPALAHTKLPDFMAKLRSVTGTGARALEFLILTAARPGEVIGARWDEIDLPNTVWVIPGSRMKSGREHRVPLSGRAVELLAGMDRKGERVFKTNPTALLDITRALHPGIVPHGFRSSFSTWASDATSVQREVVEACLAHITGSKTELAYQRSTMFEKRRELMNIWAAHCTRVPAEDDKVVELRRQA